MSSRMNVILLLVLLASALYLVRVSYDGRRLFTALDRAQSEARQLDVEHERLQAELQAQATPLRIERTAREKLAMRTATPAVTRYVDAPLPGAPVVRFASPPASAASAVGVKR
ncbi:cell division protein FtsL [Piscinibacter sakaiensis]|uniref:cell division protein FtsL n=1 Tax=Piscinibacter sakaiensis TaxID=1547922 RepID=UPI003AAC156C